MSGRDSMPLTNLGKIHFKILRCRPMNYTVYFTKVNLFGTLRDIIGLHKHVNESVALLAIFC